MLGLVWGNLYMLFFHKVKWYYIMWVFSFFLFYMFIFIYDSGMNFVFTNHHMCFDSMSFLLVFLTLCISLMMVLGSQMSVKIKINKVSLFSFYVILLNLILVLTFSVSSSFLFYFLFEVSLIPTLCLILGWGYQPERLQAGMYMMIYTVGASIPFLVLIIWLDFKFNSTNLFLLKILSYVFLVYSNWMMMLLAMVSTLVFLVKLPMFFFHLWLPKAHVEAPVSGSMVLAAVLLKLGGYGILRFISIFNLLNNSILYFLSSIALWGGLLSSIICFCQNDLKSLIAYSSIGHMSLMLISAFYGNYWGWNSCLILMVSHGFSSSALFLLANYSYEKFQTRSLFLMKGMLLYLPNLSLWWFMFCCINMAAPPSINLLGEILVFPVVLMNCFLFSLVLGIMSFLSAVYSMYLYISTQHGGSMKYIIIFSNFSCIGYFVLLCHFISSNIFILKSDLFFNWFY